VRRPIVWVLLAGSLSSGCPPRPESPGAGQPAPRPSQAEIAPQPLGEPGYLPVAPGQSIAADAALAPARADPAPSWKEVSRAQVALEGGPLQLVILELPGSGAGLVLLRPEGTGRRVINTYGIRWDGLGVEMVVRGQWTSPDRRAALLLLQVDRESRGYQATPGDESSAVEAETSRSWVVLGVTAARAWLAAPELNRHTAARFQPQPDALRLVACVSRTSAEVFELSPSTLTFGAAHPAPGPCP